MQTVDLLEQALHAAGLLGYKVRHEWLGGSGGGSCEINKQKWLFLDLAASPAEQLEQAIDCLRREPDASTLPLSPPW